MLRVGVIVTLVDPVIEGLIVVVTLGLLEVV